jgi:hypothetical protein
MIGGRFITAGLLAAVIPPFATAGERTLPPEMTPIPGKIAVMTPEPVSMGSFGGTWLYVNRDGRFALWVRTENGATRARVQFQSIVTPESFESDWNGEANYFVAGAPVRFEQKIARADSQRMDGTWFWNLDAGTTGRKEESGLVFQRTGTGRMLAMEFTSFRRTFRKAGENKVVQMPQVWTWTKVSKRELLWDELPF